MKNTHSFHGSCNFLIADQLSRNLSSSVLLLLRGIHKSAKKKNITPKFIINIFIHFAEKNTHFIHLTINLRGDECSSDF